MAEIADFSAGTTTFRINDDGTVTLTGVTVSLAALVASGAISAATLAATGSATVGGTLGVTSDIAGANVLGTGLAVVPTAASIVGGLALRIVDSGIITLDTGDASTDLDVDIPDGWAVIGVNVHVTTAIAGVDATTATIALTGGSTSSVTTFGTFTLGYKKQTMISPIIVAFGGDNAGAALTLSGGSDQTPSAGAVRVLFYCWAPQEL